MPQNSENSPKELNRLIKAIRMSSGFSLLVASSNNDNYRDKLIEKISGIFLISTSLEIKKNGFADFNEFENYLVSLSKYCSVIHVVNKGERFYRDTWPVFYKGLNYHREKIAGENPVVIVLWMRPEDVKDFALTSPDMWHWRSGVFDFDLPVDQFWSLENGDEMEKAKTRCDEILSYLNDNPGLEDALKAFLHQELGELYYAQGKYEDAEKKILDALDFFIKRGEAARQEPLYKMLESIKIMSAASTPFITKVYNNAAEIMWMREDMSFAARVQQSILPNEFPPFPLHREFDIYAKMVPAGMMGRAFYDYFFLDEIRLAFAVGQVHSRGILAALYMVKALTLLKTNALRHIDPGECLGHLNNEFFKVRWKNVSDYESFRLFYGVLNIKTGEVNYSCAGHPFPFIIRNGGGVEPIPQVEGIEIGAFENFVYEVGKIQPGKGDIMLVFTDSIVNTANPTGELFDTDNLIMYLEDRNKLALKEIIEGVLVGIKLFTEGTPQADDITMLALRFN
ncbi:MAG: phosphoserine phosphatase RsbU/P [Acidobacteriota bacterium]|nr:phosphoserine phosphatase RsbU/P [Acidobacteriota bacterium]